MPDASNYVLHRAFRGFRQRDLRIGAKGQTAFFSGEAVAENTIT